MSIIFGVKKNEGDIVTEHHLLDIASATDRWAPDGTFVSARGCMGMGFQPYHTHKLSNLESHPLSDDLGNMITLDGRLDNRAQLSETLGLPKDSLSDSQIALTAFVHLGEGCFRHFIGDWALALWSRQDQTIYLARDHAGTRTLYYCISGDALQWSTHLETLLHAHDPFPLDKAYAACYIANLQLRDLTPYKGIRAVTPAHYARFRSKQVEHSSHWRWMADDQIHYKDPKEYDARFLELFGQAVIRRTGPGAPTVAQLSGGMDSSSIVCMSDKLRLHVGIASDGLLDTISYYDDLEPSLNDRHYFNIVEQGRGKKGIHIESSFSARTYEPPDLGTGTYLLPGADSSFLERELALENRIRHKEYRVILSGIGGDELLGGVPTPLPELANRLALGELNVMARRTVQWCLVDRSQFSRMVFDTLKFLRCCYGSPALDQQVIPPWLESSLVGLCKDHYQSDTLGIGKVGLAPSQVSNGRTWWDLLETMPHRYPAYLKRREYRYPFLDRDLVDYLFRIPREEIIQPGRRRHLMRRSLAGIVPNEVIERRRKGFCARGPLISLGRIDSTIRSDPEALLVVRYGLVKPKALAASLADTYQAGDSRWSMCLMRTFALEAFLKSGNVRNILKKASESGFDRCLDRCSSFIRSA
jgi:asparagine synthase (glutamine-hydrolysing)